MGRVGNQTQEPTSNLIEQSKGSEKLAQSDNEIVVKRELIGSQNSENNLAIHEGISEDVGLDIRETGLVNVNVTSALGNLEVASKNGLTSPKNITTLSGIDSINHGDVKLESPQIDGSNGSDHLNSEDRGSYGQSKRKAKGKCQVTSSWSLRPKSQEKPKTPEPDNTVKDATVSGEKKKRGRKKGQQLQQKQKNEFSKNKSHLKYLLHRIKYEQSLIDAYSAEGWKGQSLEKLKPEKELQRAKSHILRYKVRIRELFQRLDLSFAVGKLPESLFDSLGEIDCEDIFCAKCGSKDLTLDNDIILCDGACERGFHQYCLEPPLLKEHIPPGDEGWLCPGCDCKVDCIDMLNDYLGTKIYVNDSWEKVFPEAAAAAAASGMKLDGGSGDDDSGDDDYDPDKHDTVEKVDGDQSSSDESDGYFSAPDAAADSLNKDKYLGLPSDDSEDDDFDPSAPVQDQDEQVSQDSTSSDFTSDSEDLGALLEEDDSGHAATDSKEENSTVGKTKGQSLNEELSYLMETSAEPVSSKRHVDRLDYKKLLEETYGNSSSDSSDEDFDDTSSHDDSSSHNDTSSHDDTTSRKRRKIDRANSRTPSVKSNMKNNDENQKESKQLPRRAGKKNADGGPSGSSAKAGSASSVTKRSAPKRLGEAKTQRLYASFNENQYPDKDTREYLAKELDLTVEQVRKWFENARWSFNHRPQMESIPTKKLPKPLATEKTEPKQSTATDENLLLKAGEENSGK